MKLFYTSLAVNNKALCDPQELQHALRHGEIERPSLIIDFMLKMPCSVLYYFQKTKAVKHIKSPASE